MQANNDQQLSTDERGFLDSVLLGVGLKNLGFLEDKDDNNNGIRFEVFEKFIGSGRFKANDFLANQDFERLTALSEQLRSKYLNVRIERSPEDSSTAIFVFSLVNADDLFHYIVQNIEKLKLLPEVVAFEKMTYPYIGRSWNTTRGRAIITTVHSPSRAESSQQAVYKYETEDGTRFRIDENRIEETIARNEYELTPEGIASRERESKQQESSATVTLEQISTLVALLAEVNGFLRSVNYTRLKSGLAKKTLMTRVSFKGDIIPNFKFIQALVTQGLEPMIREKEKVVRPKGIHPVEMLDLANKKREYKNEYYIGGLKVGAFEYAYASYFKAQEPIDKTIEKIELAEKAENFLDSDDESSQSPAP